MSLEALIGNIEILAIKSYRILSYPVYSFFDYIHIPRPHCRYTPTCSHYAEEAIREWGIFRGTLLSVKRVMRCNPYGSFGHDPVPKRQEVNS